MVADWKEKNIGKIIPAEIFVRTRKQSMGTAHLALSGSNNTPIINSLGDL
jgi:hypothetical protein